MKHTSAPIPGYHQFVITKQKQQQLGLVVLIALIFVVLSCQFIAVVDCQQQVTKNFADVIDAASAQYINSKEWKHLIKSNIYLPMSTCKKIDFPPTFSFNRTVMNLCYDLEAFQPWISIHETAGRLLVEAIKNQYNLPDLTYVFKKFATDDGYFAVMKNGVDSGECDVCVGASNWNKERLAQVHFQCAYGNSYQGWLRSELQNDTITINTIQELDSTGVIVVVSADTSYQNYVNSNFNKATIKVVGAYDDAWAMIANKTAHAYIADVLDLYIWVGNNREKCPGCTVHLFGEATSFGTFITKNILRISDGASTVSSWMVIANWMLLIMMVHWVIVV